MQKNSILGNLNGDTNRVQKLLNETKAKSLQFLKIVWQFLWEQRPEEIFNQENPFFNDAHFFIQMLTDTLIRLPQLDDFENLLLTPSVQKIVKKSIQVLSIFTA